MTFAYLAAVAWVTLGPQPVDTDDRSPLRVLLAFFAEHRLTDWLTYRSVEFLANVAMFVPIGMFLLLLFGRRSWLTAVLTGVGLTCVIEFAQLFLPDRVSDVRDIVANSIGGFVGVLFTLVVTAGQARRRRSQTG